MLGEGQSLPIPKPEPESLRITAGVTDWEAWTGMAFPDSGTHVFPHGLAPLEVDREEDVGRSWEPNVWVRHAVGEVRRSGDEAGNP